MLHPRAILLAALCAFLLCVLVLDALAEGIDTSCDKDRIITKATMNSELEKRQEIRKLSEGCTLLDTYTFRFATRTESVREWCCEKGRQPLPSASRKRQEGQDNVDEDGELDLPVRTMQTPWNLDRIDQPSLPLDGLYRPSALATFQEQPTVHVFVVDSGIDVRHRVFQDVDVRLSFFAPAYGTAADCDGHGTRCASIIAGYYTGVVARGLGGVENRSRIVLHSIRVVGCNGEGTISDLLRGLSWIQNYGSRGIVSISLGADLSPTLNAVLESMISEGGYLVVSAAGNEAADACRTSPASAQGVIAVGATTEGDRRASFSNFGTCVDVFAPGTNVIGAIAESTSFVSAASGTSFACPAFASAVARLMLREPALYGTDPRSAGARVLSDSYGGIVVNRNGGPNRLLQISPATFTSPSPPVANGCLVLSYTSATTPLLIAIIAIVWRTHLKS